MTKQTPNMVKDVATVGAMMRQMRANKKVSARWVAGKMKISTVALSRIENGHVIPAFDSFFLFCKVLGYSIILHNGEETQH